MFFSNFVPKTHRFEIFDFQKGRDLKTGLGSIQVIGNVTCDRAHMTSYWRSIVTMALSHVMSEIFNVEKCRDLETGVRGH